MRQMLRGMTSASSARTAEEREKTMKFFQYFQVSKGLNAEGRHRQNKE